MENFEYILRKSNQLLSVLNLGFFAYLNLRQMHLSDSDANTHVCRTTSSRRSDGGAPLGEPIPNSQQDLHVGEPTQQAQLEVPTDLKTVNDHEEVSSMPQENVSRDDTHGSRPISSRRSYSASPCVEPIQQAQQDVPTELKTVYDHKYATGECFS